LSRNSGASRSIRSLKLATSVSKGGVYRRIIHVHRTISLAAFLALSAGASAGEPTVLFDFNAMDRFDRSAQLTDYMTNVYGSSITVEGGVVSNDRSDIGIGDTNFFMATSFQLLERGDFEIFFDDVPIVGAEFEGHVLDPTVGDDFRFIAFAGDDEVFRYERDDGVEIFDSGWIQFAQPVDRILVSDSGRKDVGVDDLVVQPVPEPATMLLLGCGGWLTLRRKSVGR
jgi:hypothetical protein